jgi:restriction endonuclease S subunit
MTKTSGMYITDTEETLSDAGIANSNAKLIQKGTLLLSFKLSIGRVAMTGCDLYTNEAIAALVPKDKRVMPKYLYYILPRLGLSGSGARQAAKGQTSSKGRLEKILIPVPPLPIQVEIIREMVKRSVRVEKYQNEIRKIESEGRQFIDSQIK